MPPPPNSQSYTSGGGSVTHTYDPTTHSYSTPGASGSPVPIVPAPKTLTKPKPVVVANAKAATTDLTNKQSFLSNTQQSVMQQQLANAQAQAEKIKATLAQRQADEDAQTKANDFALKNREIDAKTGLINSAGGSSGTSSTTPTGTPPPGWDAQSYANFKAANPDIEPTSQDTAQLNSQNDQYSGYDQQIATANQQLADTNAQIDKNFQDTQDKITSIQNGSFPLNSYEQALVSGLQNSTQELLNQQKLANQNYEGGVTQAGITSGVSRYSPALASGQIFQAVSQGLTKIQNIETDGAKSMADLQQGFMDKDYNQVVDSYNRLDSLLKDKTTQIEKIHDDVEKHKDDLVAANYKAQQDAQAETDKQAQMKETAMKDAADIQNQQATQAISAAHLKLDQATYNATYGAFMNPDGTPANVNPSNIPGYNTLSNGSSIIDGSKLPPGVNKSAIGGIPVVPAADVPLVNSWSQTNSLLNKVQSEYNGLISAGKSASGSSAATQDQIRAYNADAASLNNQIASLSGAGNGQFAQLKGFTAPTVGFGGVGGLFGVGNDGGTKDNGNFTKIRDGLNSTIQQVVPKFSVPLFGQTFKTPGEVTQWATTNGYTKQLDNLKKSYPNLTAEQLMNIINTSQEPDNQTKP